jgi:ribosomal protein L37AE/L43A
MINVWENLECLIVVVGVLRNNMKYQCSKCNFHWTGTSYTFEEVREHEKTHFKKSKSKTVKANMT